MQNLDNFNLEWINAGRVSDDWKAKIFGHKINKRQLGIYHRKTKILVRLKSYTAIIPGIVVQPTMPKVDSWEASFSRFRGGKGVCVNAETLESFKALVAWYFFTECDDERK